MKLTIKQQRFADEYIISGNATKAAIEAGYSEKYANTNVTKLLQNTTIKAYIDERLAELEDKAIAKQEEVLKYLTAVMRGETLSEVVVIEGEGEGVSKAKRIDKAPDEKDRLKAAELLGKRYGTFTEKVDVTGELRTVVVDDIDEAD